MDQIGPSRPNGPNWPNRPKWTIWTILEGIDLGGLYGPNWTE